MKNVPISFSNLKSKVCQLEVDKSVRALVDISKLSDVVKNNIIKKDVVMLRWKQILKIKCLILLTQLLILRLMLK